MVKPGEAGVWGDQRGRTVFFKRFEGRHLNLESGLVIESLLRALTRESWTNVSWRAVPGRGQSKQEITKEDVW